MAELPGKKKKASPKLTKDQKEFVDFVESAPGKVVEGAKSALSSVTDLLVGRGREAEKATSDLDTELDSFRDKDLDAELDSFRDKPVTSTQDLDAELDSFRDNEVIPPGEEEKGLGTKILDRALGKDVEDPVPFIRMGTTLTGAIGGTIAGAKVGAIVTGGNPLGIGAGAVIGGITGTALGAVAPENAQRLAEFAGIIDEDSEFSRKNLELLTPDELEVLLEGEVLIEAATGGGLTVLRAATRVGTRIITGVGGKELLVAARMRKLGVDVVPVQVGKRVIPKMFVVIGGKFPLVGSPLQKAGAKAETQLKKVIRDLPLSLAPLQRSADLLGLKMFREAKDLAKAFANGFKKRYDEVYALAEEFGVTVLPKRISSKAVRIIHRLESESPAVFKDGKLVPGKLSKTNQKVVNFIKKNILPSKGAPQTLKQMDTMVTNIDEFLATLEPGQKKFARKLLIELRQAGQMDMIRNMRGVNSGEIAQRLRNIDKDFSHMSADLFETSLAQQITKFTKKGLRGAVVDSTTKSPTDTLVNLVKLESPEAMTDLAKLVSPKTYKEITAKVLDDVVKSSIKDTDDVGAGIGKLFNVDKFNAKLGLDNKLSSRYATMKKMLEISGGFKIEELEAISKAASLIADLPIPNVAQFIARRAVFSGVQSFVGTILPGVVAGGTARGFGMDSFVKVMIFLGGGRAFSAAISNPNTVQSLRLVMSSEVSEVVRRGAWIKAMRASIQQMFGDDDQFIARIGGAKTVVEESDFKKGVNKSFDIIVNALDKTFPPNIEEE